MATAPFQLWVEMAPIASAVRVSSTVTITTTRAHGITTGADIYVEGATGAAGTSMVGVYQVTVTSGSAFTYTAAGSAGTAVISAACISYDLFNPIIDYAAANRQAALYAIPETLQMSATGDGTGSTLSFTVAQDVTPTEGPWYTLIPDEARVRLIKANTGTTPAADKSDVFFLASIRAVTARLNGSGQGTLADIDLVDPTAHLDRIAVFGNAQFGQAIVLGGLVRSSNVVTVTTAARHGFTAGQRVALDGTSGGGGTNFSGTWEIASVPSPTTFTYNQTGPNATGGTAIIPTAASFVSGSRQRIRYTVPVNHGFSRQVVKISGVTHSNSTINLMANGLFSIKLVASSAIEVELPIAAVPGGTFTVTSATITPIPSVGIPANWAPRLRVSPGSNDFTAVTNILDMVDGYKFNDYALQRVINTSDTSKIVGTSATLSNRELLLPLDTLSSALDSVVELFNGRDGKARRYWVNNAGQLEFRVVDTAAQPLYGSAPYKIVIDGAGTPNTTTTAATVAPMSLELSYDHETTKNIVLSTPPANPLDVAGVYNANYISAGYAARANSPEFDAIIEAPSVKPTTPKFYDLVAESASTYMQERRAPVLSATFMLGGAGTASFNNLGFSAGYALLDLGTISTASRTGSTVTITMATAHGLASGATVAIAGITGTAGTSMNGTATVTVTTTTAFTYTSAGTAGSGTVTAATAYGAKLVSRWEPGQWVDVAAPQIGLSGLYRVEQVNWSLYPGSFTQRIAVTINRTPTRSMTKILAKRLRAFR
jgi:hypothetical protein